MAYTLLIADNSQSAQKALQMALSDLDYDIHTYQDGNKLLEALTRMSPDVLVLGLSLAGKNGYEITRFLNSREQYESLPLILLQDAFVPLLQEKFKDLKYTAIFQKPFDSEELAQRIRVVVGEMNDPDTLPEELEETQEIPGRDDKGRIDGEQEWEEIIKQRVKQEMVGLERELEKRITARIKAAIKVGQAYELDDNLSSHTKGRTDDD